MILNNELLKNSIAEMAVLIEHNDDPDPQLYAVFFQHPEYAIEIINYISLLDEDSINEGPPLYAASVFALDICVAQLQAASEANNKPSTKALQQLMSYLAKTISSHSHSLSFWLPVLNAFYEVHVELNQELKDAYFELASQDEEAVAEMEPGAHLDSIRDLIHELSDLSVFDIAENFFAQSYAMPPEFFADLILDLYNIEEGKDIALLTLLHPKQEVREVAIDTLDQLMSLVTLTSSSLTRLQVIQYWYPDSYRNTFERWIKIQRKKGVIFNPEPKHAKLKIKATEVDGTGSQGLFIHVGQGRKNRLCGLLLKYEHGVKDAWLTPMISAAEVLEYYQQAFEDSVTIREVDVSYFQSMVEHFMAVSIEKNAIPNLHFLEILELIGLRLRPSKMNLETVFEEISVQIIPFTEEVIQESLKRSKSWLKSKQFTESWYLESGVIDKIVNHNSSFVNGVKVCRLYDAMEAVFEEEIELHRDKWLFHFLWVALWVKAKARSNEKVWQDSFLIAYCINQGMPLKDIPVLKEVCYQTVINSVETMQERRSHLSPE